MKITEQYLKENNACSESYSYLRKKKLLGEDSQIITDALYKDKKYDWCFWLLYRTTKSAKIYLLVLILFSYLLSGISFNLSLNYESDVVAAVVAVGAVVAVVAVAAVAGAVVAVAAGVAAGAVVAIVAVIAIVAVVGVATVVATIIGDKFFIKLGCWISIKKNDRE